VHLDVGDNSLDVLMERFFANPKPVAWSGHFTIRRGESRDEALRRCYPLLLQTRLKKYRELAHMSIPAETLRETNAEETLRHIRDKLTV
jgi:hypothetical protein